MAFLETTLQFPEFYEVQFGPELAPEDAIKIHAALLRPVLSGKFTRTRWDEHSRQIFCDSVWRVRIEAYRDQNLLTIWDCGYRYGGSPDDNLNFFKNISRDYGKYKIKIAVFARGLSPKEQKTDRFRKNTMINVFKETFLEAFESITDHE